MERKAVANKKPKPTLFLPVPRTSIILKAIRLCKFHFCMAIPKTKPPIKRKINGCPYEEVIFSKGTAPDKGKITIGNKEVTASTRDSVIHQETTQRVHINTAWTSDERLSNT